MTGMGPKVLGKYTSANNPSPIQVTLSRQTDFVETMKEAAQKFGADS